MVAAKNYLKRCVFENYGVTSAKKYFYRCIIGNHAVCYSQEVLI